MSTNKLWGKDIANDTMLAANMPKWYAHTCVVNLDTAKTEDGFLDLSRGPTYQVGDQLMFIIANKYDGSDFEQAQHDNSGQIYTVAEVTSNNKVKFEQGMPAGTGVYFICKFVKNEDFEPDVEEAYVPATIEMILADQKSKDRPLAKKGICSPGWYRYRAITKVRPDVENPDVKIIASLLVSMKGFHSPDGTSGDAGETFQPGTGDHVGDGEITFDENGEITLG